MTPIDEQYDHIIDPVNFIKNFPDGNGFREWCKLGGIKDLMDALKVFEKNNLFEHCIIIQSEIDNQCDAMLEGFGID